MNKLTLTLLSLVLVVFAGTAMAEKKPKSTILHCGCSWDGADASMVYGENNINSKSRGHDAHVFGSMDSCFDGQVLVEDALVDVYTDFVRTASDCQLDGPPLGDPIDACTTQEEADAA
jgi:hypothetical protein